MTVLWIILAFAGGYVASIYTWPHVRTFVIGAEEEARNLRNRATAIMAAFKGK